MFQKHKATMNNVLNAWKNYKNRWGGLNFEMKHLRLNLSFQSVYSNFTYERISKNIVVNYLTLNYMLSQKLKMRVLNI